jgi:endonuclease/exonuclease/phosphatase family metal-dependent hydrolase
MPTRKKRKRKHWFIDGLLRLISLIIAIGLIISCLAQFIPPDKFWPPAFFGLSFPFWFLTNLFFLFFWIIRRARFAWIHVACLILSLPLFSHFVQLKGSKNSDNLPSSISLLSYNIKGLAGTNSTTSSGLSDSLFNFINNENASIVCLQEYTERQNKNKPTVQTIFSTMPLKYTSKSPYYENNNSHYYIATLSQYPICNTIEIRKDKRLIALITDIVAGKDTFRIFNVHLQSISFNDENYKFLAEAQQNISSLQSDSMQKDSKKVFWKIRTGFVKRASQARILNKAIQQSPYPMIVCGDFNDTPASYAYHTIKNDLTDAFMEKGKGIGNTYFGNLPKIRIDYVLLHPKFKCQEFEIIEETFSDHHPVKAMFYKKKYD